MFQWKKWSRLARILVVGCLAIGGAACTTETCVNSPESALGIELWGKTADGRDTLLSQQDLPAFRLEGKNETYSTKVRKGILFFPLDAQKSQTTLFFQRANVAAPDTLVLSYQNQPLYLSESCGFALRFRNLSIQRHSFRQADLLISQVDTALKTHIRLYVP